MSCEQCMTHHIQVSCSMRLQGFLLSHNVSSIGDKMLTACAQTRCLELVAVLIWRPLPKPQVNPLTCCQPVAVWQDNVVTDKSTTSDRFRACAVRGKMHVFNTSKGVHTKKVGRASASKGRRWALLSHTSGKGLESSSKSGFPGRWHLQTLLSKGSAHCCPATWAGARSL